MTYAQARTRFDDYFLRADTVDPVITDTQRDDFINESYLEYFASFGAAFFYTADFGITNSASISSENNRSWVEVEGLEFKSGSIYIPLVREDWLTVLWLQASEGAEADPRIYGMVMEQRTPPVDFDLSTIAFYVYPLATLGRTFRAKVRRSPAELSAAGDVLALDEHQADQSVRIACVRAGLPIGYSLEWAEALTASIPDSVRNVMRLQRHGAKASIDRAPVAVLAS